ncbi:hypothetical protein PAPYR_1705 [Paratrimastix pyriformis]|uniref:F-box domain-containing protein n=1 Tax=Paratrimastix pyriformis TaxID=342808 RepID=A0ABQ8UVL5_9EUKA|nr:hypothetical protein PAPYR_1705 [Paratrimastix pyriformis]
MAANDSTACSVSYDDLPVDIWGEIASHCDPQTLGNLRLISRHCSRALFTINKLLFRLPDSKYGWSTRIFSTMKPTNIFLLLPNLRHIAITEHSTAWHGCDHSLVWCCNQHSRSMSSAINTAWTINTLAVLTNSAVRLDDTEQSAPASTPDGAAPPEAAAAAPTPGDGASKALEKPPVRIEIEHPMHHLRVLHLDYSQSVRTGLDALGNALADSCPGLEELRCGVGSEAYGPPQSGQSSFWAALGRLRQLRVLSLPEMNLWLPFDRDAPTLEHPFFALVGQLTRLTLRKISSMLPDQAIAALRTLEGISSGRQPPLISQLALGPLPQLFGRPWSTGLQELVIGEKTTSTGQYEYRSPGSRNITHAEVALWRDPVTWVWLFPELQTLRLGGAQAAAAASLIRQADRAREHGAVVACATLLDTLAALHRLQAQASGAVAPMDDQPEEEALRVSVRGLHILRRLGGGGGGGWSLTHLILRMPPGGILNTPPAFLAGLTQALPTLESLELAAVYNLRRAAYRLARAPLGAPVAKPPRPPRYVYGPGEGGDAARGGDEDADAGAAARGPEWVGEWAGDQETMPVAGPPQVRHVSRSVWLMFGDGSRCPNHVPRFHLDTVRLWFCGMVAQGLFFPVAAPGEPPRPSALKRLTLTLICQLPVTPTDADAPRGLRADSILDPQRQYLELAEQARRDELTATDPQAAGPSPASLRQLVDMSPSLAHWLTIRQPGLEELQVEWIRMPTNEWGPGAEEAGMEQAATTQCPALRRLAVRTSRGLAISEIYMKDPDASAPSTQPSMTELTLREAGPPSGAPGIYSYERPSIPRVVEMCPHPAGRREVLPPAWRARYLAALPGEGTEAVGRWHSATHVYYPNLSALRLLFGSLRQDLSLWIDLPRLAKLSLSLVPFPPASWDPPRDPAEQAWRHALVAAATMTRWFDPDLSHVSPLSLLFRRLPMHTGCDPAQSWFTPLTWGAISSTTRTDKQVLAQLRAREDRGSEAHLRCPALRVFEVETARPSGGTMGLWTWTWPMEWLSVECATPGCPGQGQGQGQEEERGNCAVCGRPLLPQLTKCRLSPVGLIEPSGALGHTAATAAVAPSIRQAVHAKMSRRYAAYIAPDVMSMGSTAAPAPATAASVAGLGGMRATTGTTTGGVIATTGPSTSGVAITTASPHLGLDPGVATGSRLTDLMLCLTPGVGALCLEHLPFLHSLILHRFDQAASLTLRDAPLLAELVLVSAPNERKLTAARSGCTISWQATSRYFAACRQATQRGQQPALPPAPPPSPFDEMNQPKVRVKDPEHRYPPPPKGLRPVSQRELFLPGGPSGAPRGPGAAGRPPARVVVVTLGPSFPNLVRVALDFAMVFAEDLDAAPRARPSPAALELRCPEAADGLCVCPQLTHLAVHRWATRGIYVNPPALSSDPTRGSHFGWVAPGLLELTLQECITPVVQVEGPKMTSCTLGLVPPRPKEGTALRLVAPVLGEVHFRVTGFRLSRRQPTLLDIPQIRTLSAMPIPARLLLADTEADPAPAVQRLALRNPVAGRLPPVPAEMLAPHPPRVPRSHEYKPLISPVATSDDPLPYILQRRGPLVMPGEASLFLPPGALYYPAKPIPPVPLSKDPWARLTSLIFAPGGRRAGGTPEQLELRLDGMPALTQLAVLLIRAAPALATVTISLWTWLRRLVIDAPGLRALGLHTCRGTHALTTASQTARERQGWEPTQWEIRPEEDPELVLTGCQALQLLECDPVHGLPRHDGLHALTLLPEPLLTPALLAALRAESRTRPEMRRLPAELRPPTTCRPPPEEPAHDAPDDAPADGAAPVPPPAVPGEDQIVRLHRHVAKWVHDSRRAHRIGARGPRVLVPLCQVRLGPDQLGTAAHLWLGPQPMARDVQEWATEPFEHPTVGRVELITTPHLHEVHLPPLAAVSIRTPEEAECRARWGCSRPADGLSGWPGLRVSYADPLGIPRRLGHPGVGLARPPTVDRFTESLRARLRGVRNMCQQYTRIYRYAPGLYRPPGLFHTHRTPFEPPCRGPRALTLEEFREQVGLPALEPESLPPPGENETNSVRVLSDRDATNETTDMNQAFDRNPPLYLYSTTAPGQGRLTAGRTVRRRGPFDDIGFGGFLLGAQGWERRVMI